ncbi:MAG TPA: hypothetical protein VEL76_24645 [Gemmataceae bacterium]|nr:hypothetical protein [Gemmataceae bacterium]
MAKKSSCPITRAEFREHAKALTVKIGEREYKAIPKEFSTGSLGWNVNEKMTVEINGKEVTLQVGMNLTVVGSKELPQDHPPPPSAPASA